VENTQVVALIAYIQRIGIDLFALPDAETPETPAGDAENSTTTESNAVEAETNSGVTANPESENLKHD
jgi:hypothetical protein